MPHRRPARPARATPRGKRRVRLDTDERRAQLLALARAAFSDRAYDDVSVDDLARDAGISKGLLYHYFPTKRDLYVAALRQIADELVTAITAVPLELPPIERVRAGVDAYLAHVSRHARPFVALMRGGIGSDPQVAAVIEGVRERLFDRFLAGSPFAALLKGDARFELAVRGWLGFVEAASIDWCAHPRLDRVALRELLADVLAEVIRIAAPAAVAAAPRP